MTARSTEQMEAMRQRWLRCAADLENLQQRMGREIERQTRRAHQAALLDFIEVIDSLERALALSEPDDDRNAWYRGMKAIHLQMLAVLRRQGARPFDARGRLFDPQRHDAVSCVVSDEHPPGVVVQVTKTGYEMNNGVLLRCAEVITNQRKDHDG